MTSLLQCCNKIGIHWTVITYFSGFMGYASDVYSVVSLHDVRNDDDDQLYYTQIFINKELRDQYKIKLDTQAKIFQNLNGQFGEFFFPSLFGYFLVSF